MSQAPFTARPHAPSSPSADGPSAGPSPTQGPKRSVSAYEGPAREFLAYCKVECGFASATIAAYAGDIRDLWVWMVEHEQRGWGSLTLDLIGQHLRDLQAKGHETSTIARHVATIRVFCRFMEQRGFIETNPAEQLTQPRGWQRLPNVMAEDNIKKLLAAPSPDDPFYLRDVALLELMYAGGLRASEVAGLDMDSVKMDLGIVRVMGKGSKERIVPIGRPAIEAVQRYLLDLRPALSKPDHPNDKLFLSRTGHEITRVVVWQIVTRLAKRAGLSDVHPHTLRHSFATHMLAGGADLRVVQELLGHSNIRTTQVYTHVDRSRLSEVISKFHPRP